MTDLPTVSDCLVARIAAVARERPETIAVVSGAWQLTYRQLVTIAADLAKRLSALNIHNEEPVGVSAVRGVEFVAGAFGAMAAGRCYVPLDSCYPAERLQSLITRAGIRVIVVPSRDWEPFAGMAEHILSIDVAAPIDDCVLSLPPDGCRLAYELFTSGSTGVPRIVPIEHRSVCAFLDGFDLIARPRARVVSTSVCPFSFDVSVWEMYSALTTGGTLHILEASYARDGSRLADYVCARSVTTAYIPPFALDVFVEELRRIGSVGALDRVLVGVEPIPQATLQNLRDLSADLHIINGYGPTEATICSTLFPFGHALDRGRRTPIGRPVAGWCVNIVDEGLAPVPVGAVGEIMVGGAGLARGYVGDAALTNERFVKGQGGERWYRTGDLGRWLPSGILEFVGRRDEQVKVRGFRVELGEIEATLRQYPEVRAAMTLAPEGPGGRRLVAFVEGAVDGQELRRRLARTLPEYMVPSRVVVIDRFPVTANGKVDRLALLAMDRSRPLADALVAPRGTVQERLAEVWREVLELDTVGVHDNFFDLGGNSLLAQVAAGRATLALGNAAVARVLLRYPTIAEAAKALETGDGGIGRDGRINWRDETTSPLSFGQVGLWTRQQLDPDNTAFVLPVAFRVRGPIDDRTLATAVERLLDRHEAFRLEYAVVDGQPRLIPSVAPPGVDFDSAEIQDAVLASEVARRFADSARAITSLTGPLIRARVIRVGCEDRIILLAVHHLAMDGSSVPVISSDLASLIDHTELGVPSCGPRAFAARQRDRVGTLQWERDRAHWMDVLTPLPEALALPLDGSRPARRTGGGRTTEHALSDRAFDAIAVTARRFATTPFVVLMTAIGALAYRFSGQDDFVVATPIGADRCAEALMNAVGYFVNLLPVRFRITRSTGFGALLEATRRALQDAIVHGDLPFEVILEAMPDPTPDRSIRFTRLVIAQEISPGLPRRAGDVEIHEFTVDHATSKYELTVFVAEEVGRLRLRWEHDSALFTPVTISGFQEALELLLIHVGADPAIPVGQINLAGDADVHRVMVDFNDAARPYAVSASLIDVFDDHVRRAPSAIALESHDRLISYADLRDWSGQIALSLGFHGVSTETPVLVLVERSLEFVAAVLGVLRAGGCYVPVDARHPAERLQAICETVGVRHAIASATFVDRLPSEIVVLTPHQQIGASAAQLGDLPARGPESLAYVMFTSGSTGSPKGVAVPDRAVVRLVHRQNFANFDATDAFVLSSNLAFDAATFEIWGALLNGGRLVVPSDFVVQDPTELAATIKRTRVTAGFFNVSMFGRILDVDASALKGMHTIIVGGEVVPDSLFVRAAETLDFRVLVNGYGPTENTTFSCCHRLRQRPVAGQPVPIGRPIASSIAVVVDEGLAPVPVGAVGEIMVGGAGLARGYVGDAALTNERFVKGQGGERWYRTGDLGRWLPSGILEFVGRRDEQVKVRGFRVELGEIEATLRQYPEVRAAMTLAPEGPGGRRLVAFVEGAVDGQELRRRLARTLPEYMVPSRVVVIDRFPVTANGKVDRLALLAMDRSRPLADALVAPRGTVQERLAEVWREVLELDTVGVHDNFFDLGGNSLLLVVLADHVRRSFRRDVRVLELFDRPTIAEFAEFLVPKPSFPTDLAAADTEETARDCRMRPKGEPHANRIAIVGFAGRFPGAPDVGTFWKRTIAGIVDIRSTGDSRPGVVARRGVVDGIDRFDAAFFGVPDREAQLIDPQQRVLLEVAQHALDDAGIDPSRQRGVVAVYAACGPSELAVASASLSEEYERNLASAPDFAATRISYRLGLRGESITVQTGCSSSLVAVHLACQSLLSGQSDIVLAGGVSFVLDQERGYVVEDGMITSPTGRCRPFEASADGTVPGGGAAMVVLMRLADARRDCNRVRAVILGSALNNDGATRIGFMAPSAKGQADVIAAAHLAAGVKAGSIGYVETHGTATRLGDAIEIEGLRRAFALDPSRTEPCALGSLKGNCGHLDRAAGIAGLIRGVLAVEQAVIPPMADFEQPNPDLALAEAGFVIPREALAWRRADTPRRAGVSAFGVGGTNVHVVLEEAAATDAEPMPPSKGAVLVTVAGHTVERLTRQTAALSEWIEANDTAQLSSIARTLAIGRRVDRHRGFVVATDTRQLGLHLRAPREFFDSEPVPQVVFAFPGHGDAEVDGLEELYRDEPAYRAALDKCAQKIQAYAGYDIREDLYACSGRSRRDRFADLSRYLPAMFTVEWALAELWTAWGVRPDALLGHSLGEVVAAARARVFDLDDALQFIVERGRFMQETPPGAMLSVALAPTVLEEYLEQGTVIAAVNGRELVTVSGPPEAVDRLERRLTGDAVTTRRLSIARAAHGPAMRNAATRLRVFAEKLHLRLPTIPLLSNVTGDWANGRIATGEYWSSHLTMPVQFAASLNCIASMSRTIVVEVGPGVALGRLIAYELGTHADCVISSAPSPGSNGGTRCALLEALGHLWARGVSCDVAASLGTPLPPKVPLPLTALDHRRSWPTSVRPAADRSAVAPVGKRTDDPGAWIWDSIAAPIQRSGIRAASSLRHVSIGAESPWRTEFEALARVAGCSVTCYDNSAELLPSDVTDIVWWTTAHQPITLVKSGQIAREASRCQARVWMVVILDDTDEEATSFSHALALAAVRVAPQEEPGAEWHLITVRASNSRRIASALLDAVTRIAPPAILEINDDDLLANTIRHAWPDWRARPLRPNGCYVITGGFGRVGRAIVRAITREVPAQVVLLGRRSFAAVATAMSSFAAEVESSGSRVAYEQVDVTDEAGVARCFAALRARYGRIDGVVHAAGFTDRAKFTLLDATDIATLETVAAAKVLGIRNLSRALSAADADFVILCSSLSTVLGGVRFGAYIVANALLDAFARNRWLDGDRRWISVAWDAWTGSSGNDVGPARYALSDDDGYEVFRRVLAAPGPVLLVSTCDLEVRAAEVRVQVGGGDRSPDVYDAHASSLDPRATVADVLLEVLGRHPTDPQRDLRDYGVESLTILQIVIRMRARLGIDVALADAMRSLSLAGLTRLASTAIGERKSSKARFEIKRVPVAREYPTTSTQRRWLELMPEGYGGIDVVIHVDNSHDTVALAQAVTRVIARHSGLRTHFKRSGSTWLQRVEDGVPVATEDLCQLDAAGRAVALASFVRERSERWFDVEAAAPFHVTVVRLDAESHALVIHAHHVLFDGWSSSLFLRDVARALDGELGEVPLQYVDYATAQQRYLCSAAVVPLRDYWARHFENAPPPTRVPPDRQGQAANDSGEMISFEIGALTTKILRARARALASTPFAMMLAAFGVLLHELTGNDDLVLGTTTAGRPSPEAEEIVGVFVNPLPLRLRVARQTPLGSYLAHVDEVLVNFHEHGHYPLEDLVTHVAPFIQVGLNDTFHCYLLYQNYWRPETTRVKFSRMDLLGSPHHKLMRELELVLEDHECGIRGELWFRPSRFSRRRAQSWGTIYRTILERLASESLSAPLTATFESRTEASQGETK